MVAPARESFNIFSRCMALSGVSLGTSINFPRSFNIQSAERSIRLKETPEAILPRVPMEQGDITIVLFNADPLARGAVIRSEG